MRTLIDLEHVGPGRYRLRVRRESSEGAVRVVGSIEGSLESARHIANRAVSYWAAIDDAVESEPSTRRRPRFR
ncbi:MAG: hypothetical protein R3B13_15240 [Polyangiaceae bacterium]